MRLDYFLCLSQFIGNKEKEWKKTWVTGSCRTRDMLYAVFMMNIEKTVQKLFLASPFNAPVAVGLTFCNLAFFSFFIGEQ